MSSGESGATDNRLIGTWSYMGGKMTAKFNSKGRVKTVTADSVCLGGYSTSAGMLAINYDKGQPRCIGGILGYEVLNDGNTLQFGIVARYERVDHEDDPSF